MPGEPGVGIVDTHDHKSGQEHTDRGVDNVECGYDKWIGVLSHVSTNLRTQREK